MSHVQHSVCRATNALVQGLNYPRGSLPFCTCCTSGNSTRSPSGHDRNSPAQVKFERVHTDLWGPMRGKAEGSNDKYAVSFIDEATVASIFGASCTYVVLFNTSCISMCSE